MKLNDRVYDWIDETDDYFKNLLKVNDNLLFAGINKNAIFDEYNIYPAVFMINNEPFYGMINYKNFNLETKIRLINPNELLEKMHFSIDGLLVQNVEAKSIDKKIITKFYDCIKNDFIKSVNESNEETPYYAKVLELGNNLTHFSKYFKN